jgi:hypothetical protein
MGHWCSHPRRNRPILFTYISGVDDSVQSVQTPEISLYLNSCRNLVLLTPGLRYLQMSGMVLGSMLEADHRVREYEARVRMQRRLMRDRAKWQQYEEEYLKGNGKD